jgi:sodium/potassium-transporting ATPase subunit alpha
VIIIDDNFATIVNGIHQGRLLFDNLKKVIAYLLPAGCFSEILPVLAYIFIGLPLPLTTLQMIAIFLGTDIIGSMGMVYECQESDLMKRRCGPSYIVQCRNEDLFSNGAHSVE